MRQQHRKIAGFGIRICCPEKVRVIAVEIDAITEATNPERVRGTILPQHPIDRSCPGVPTSRNAYVIQIPQFTPDYGSERAIFTRE